MREQKIEELDADIIKFEIYSFSLPKVDLRLRSSNFDTNITI